MAGGWDSKFGVAGAIPGNGDRLHQAGVVVSFNSDDAGLGRRLNHEAARATKYGGVPEAGALKFVTLNPARQLRIDKRVGSIPQGLAADLVLWEGHPHPILGRYEPTSVHRRRALNLR